MTVQESKIISFCNTSVETEGLFKDLSLKYLSHISFRDSDGDIISKESFCKRVIQNIPKYVDSYKIIEDLIRIQLEKSSSYVKMVTKMDLKKLAQFGEGENFIFGFLEENFRERRYIFILGEDVFHYIQFNIVFHNLIENFYPVSQFYANEARTDGALFVEGEQPSGYSLCEVSEMYNDID